MLQPRREAMIVAVSSGIHPCDGSETLDGSAWLNAKRSTGSVRKRLVVITENRKPQTTVPVVSQFKNRVFRQLLLDTEEPALDIGPTCIGRNVTHVRVHLVEVRRACKIRRESCLTCDESRI